MSNVNSKHLLFEQLARVAKALSSANRLEILEFLAQGERHVEALAKLTGLSVANVSQHLQQLKAVGLVSARKQGLRVHYSLADQGVVDLVGALRNVAEKSMAEVKVILDSYFKVKDDLEPVPAGELWKRAKDGLVTVLDVRPQEEYASGHVPGAINVPLKDLEKWIKTLKRKKEVIAYCRGPYCVLAFDAVEKLRTKGVAARRMEDGFPEWKRANLPVEKG
ncbi:MAG: metalloregulator ArsR/SmtB family transcription factor [Nitrospinota bacterium]|nr:metalloregulator ArsR/SmtB family transcription factor [Nitrospinota bacterium]